jgi:hypothetical protein
MDRRRAVAAIADLPRRCTEAVRGLGGQELLDRPVAGMWSVAGYCDHIREVLFALRFVVRVALDESGTDLGPPPADRFDLGTGQ